MAEDEPAGDAVRGRGLCRGRRFEVVRELGRGGEGRVVEVREVLAVREASGSPALAMKEARTGHMPALRAEFELLSRLAHPHVVAVHDFFAVSPVAEPGVSAAAYTLEMVGGLDFVEAFLVGGLRVSSHLPRLVEQLLGALAQLHSSGIAHLDLKPQNLLVEGGDDPRVRLIDFGIAARIGEPLQKVFGSRSYIAPELSGGLVAPAITDGVRLSVVDARADLFSLGVVLTQVLLGRVGSPNRARALADVAADERLSALRQAAGSGVSDDVSAVIELASCCLDPDPAGRPRSAAAAAHFYGRARRRGLVLVGPAAALAMARSGGLVARDAELEEVVRALRSRRFLRLGGPAGSGRTALIDAAVRATQVSGLVCERWPAHGRVPTIEDFAVCLDRLVGDEAGVLGARLLALGEPIRTDGSASGPDEFEARLNQVVDAAVAALLQAEPAPCALAIGRPDEAPLPVRRFLLRLASGVEAGRALPLGLVVRVDAASGGNTMELGGTSLDGVRLFLNSRFGVAIANDPELVAWFFATSAGLFGELEALAELLVATGRLGLGPDGWSFTGGDGGLAALTPASRVRARLASFSPLARRVVGVMASIGEAVPRSALVRSLVAVLPRSDGEAVSESLGTLELATWLEARGGDVSLARGLVQALEEPSEEVRTLTRQVLASLRDQVGTAALSPGLSARIAGGLAGASLLLEPIRAAIQGFRFEEAERLCLLGLELAASSPRSDAVDVEVELYGLRAEIADRLGPREAQRAALVALAQALRPEDPRQLDVKSRLFWTLTRMGDPSFEAEGDTLRLGALAANRPFLAAEVAVHLAIVKTQRGEQDAAEALLLEAGEALDRQVGSAQPSADAPDERKAMALRARIHNNLGNVAMYRGKHATARERYARALELKRLEGDPVGQRIALGNLALADLELDRPADALRGLIESRAVALTTGHRRGVAWSCLTMAELGLECGALNYARRRAEQAAAIAHELGDLLVEGDALTTLAEVELALGEPMRLTAERGAALAREAKNGWTRRRAELLMAVADGAELSVFSDDVAADPGTRRLAARYLAERAMEQGSLDLAISTMRPWLLPSAGTPSGRPGRAGLRAANLWLTGARALSLTGDPVAEQRHVASAVKRLRAWMDALPATPLSDGVDPESELDGPSRLTAASLAPVQRLLALLDARAPLGQDISVTAIHDTSSGLTAGGPIHPGDTRGADLLSAHEDLMTGDAAAIARVMSAELVGLLRAEQAERAYIFVFEGEFTGASKSFEFVEGRDADGEAIEGARKKIPEVAIEAARRGAGQGDERGLMPAWRASGDGGRGSIVVVPFALPVGGQCARGAVVLQNRFVGEAFSDLERVVERVKPVALVARLLIYERALAAAIAERERVSTEARQVVRESTEEIRTLRRELESTREQLGPVNDYGAIVFSSGAMKRMLRQVDRVVSTDLPVHIHGESGTGKELIARAVHDLGVRKGGPFLAQNCTAIPPTLFESELFGHERGSFTGAVRSTEGLFRRAHHGTLFLDEIGDLPLELQAKLLRVLETGEVRPVGATKSQFVDVRILSATHRDLSDLIKKGLFREDLYYRLNVIRIEVPPLRDRPEDIPVLVNHFLSLKPRPGKGPIGIDDLAMKALVRFPWPGNVRQLENEISRAALLADGELIALTDLSADVAELGRQGGRPGVVVMAAPGGGDSLGVMGLGAGQLKDRVDRLETLVLQAALAEANHNKSEVARVLGLSRAGLNLKLKRLGLWDGE